MDPEPLFCLIRVLPPTTRFQTNHRVRDVTKRRAGPTFELFAFDPGFRPKPHLSDAAIEAANTYDELTTIPARWSRIAIVTRPAKDVFRY